MAYHFLLIDDSSIVRKVVIKAMGLTPLEISKIGEANNGQEGLAYLKDNWVDLVFLDINMPVMNGVEFMEELRKDDLYKDLPVVVVSTEGSQDRIDRLKELGVRAYLRKPVTPEELTETVTALLEGECR